jgi:lysophospholipase L1-like esterase
MKGMLRLALIGGFFFMNVSTSHAELPWQFEEHTRYMVMGDSLSSGYGATPQTHGYAYQLYQTGIVDKAPRTLFCNASVIGVTSADVLAYQIPQAYVFKPDVVTLTVGGNDLAKIIEGADPELALPEFQANLTAILYHLVIELRATVYISNLYVIDRIPGAEQIIPIFNQIVAGVANGYGVAVADIYSPFQDKKGLLLIERKGASPVEIHPTNAGHTAIAKAFAEVMQ